MNKACRDSHPFGDNSQSWHPLKELCGKFKIYPQVIQHYTHLYPLQLGLVGRRIEHSFSPQIHQAFLDHWGLLGSYKIFSFTSLNVGEFLKKSWECGIGGLNITMPFKEVVGIEVERPWSLVPVNTLVWTPQGYVGYNTDALALYEALGCWPHVSKALVLGCGGVAQASLWALKQRGVPHIALSSRRVFQEDGVEWIPWDQWRHVVSSFDFVIQATSLKDLTFPVVEGQRRVDWVYCLRSETPFLKGAFEKITGLELLKRQARLSFYLWTGG